MLKVPNLPEKLQIFPSSHRISIVVLRTVQSPMVLRTDEVTNTAMIPGATPEDAPSMRVAMVKRKAVAAERRMGRELLLGQGFIAEDKTAKSGIKCEYNTAPCKRCPDCFLYGSAIGDSLSVKSRVLTEDSYSLQPYSESTVRMTFNGASEEGTMNLLKGVEKSGELKGEMLKALGEQEYVKEGTQFISVVTLRDATNEALWYVLGNILRTKRYGAQTTRGGGMKNQILAIIVGNGEIISNYELTSKLTPVAGQSESAIEAAAIKIIKEDLSSQPAFFTVYEGETLKPLIQEVISVHQDQSRAKAAVVDLGKQIDDNIKRHVTHYAKSKKKGDDESEDEEG